MSHYKSETGKASALSLDCGSGWQPQERFRVSGFKFREKSNTGQGQRARGQGI